MACVYLLRSMRIPNKRYKGTTKNLQRRLKQHNTKSKKFKYTNIGMPWECVAYFSGLSQTSALILEYRTKHNSYKPPPTQLSKLLCTIWHMALQASRLTQEEGQLKTSRGKKVKRPKCICLTTRVTLPACICKLPGIRVVSTKAY